MKNKAKKILLVCALAMTQSVLAGVALTVENDFFKGNDNNYSHGTELEWNQYTFDENGLARRIGYGINQLLYTPQDITAVDQPPKTDRAWCGTLSLYREDWTTRGSEDIRIRYSLGIMGRYSYAEQSQKTVHLWLDDRPPNGWSNQMPTEPMFNVYYDRYPLLTQYRLDEMWRTDLKGIYGGTLGSTFINGRVGLQYRLGYNIPPYAVPGGIVPKDAMSKYFAYFIADAQGMWVLHNATIGNSFIRDREDWQESELKRLVAECRYGAVFGYGDLSISYMSGQRTAEFDSEEDGDMDYGMVKIEYTRIF